MHRGSYRMLNTHCTNKMFLHIFIKNRNKEWYTFVVEYESSRSIDEEDWKKLMFSSFSILNLFIT